MVDSPKSDAFVSHCVTQMASNEDWGNGWFNSKSHSNEKKRN